MRGLILRSAWFLVLFLGLLPLACKPQGYPDAPPGYDYRTLHVKWKYEGERRGTRELYVETKGYENGKLIVKRMADIHDLVADLPGKPGEVTTDTVVFFNVEGKHHVIFHDMDMVGIANVEIAPLMRSIRTEFWLPVLRYLIRRDEMTMEQRSQIQSRLLNITDEELLEFGATIDEQELMGHRVKHYVVPIADGTAELWMYGDVTLKYVLESAWRGMEVRNTVEATELEINEDLPESVFTIPEGYRIIDKTKPIEEQ